MPTDAGGPYRQQLRARRVLRLTLGTTVAFWLSQAGDWTVAYIAPLLTLTLLALPLPGPSIRLFVGVFVALVASIYAGFLFLPMLLHQPLAGLVFLSLALFHSFYFTARGGSAAIGTFITISLALTVAVGSVSVDALVSVAEGVSICAGVGVATALAAHALLPDPPRPAQAGEPARDAATPSQRQAVRSAFRSMCIVLPITLWFLASSASAANAAVMIKVASMGQEVSDEDVRDAARSLLVSTLAGGIAAVIAWELLAIWPSLSFYTLLIALASLVFAGRIFGPDGPRPDAATWSYGLLTMIVVLAPAATDSLLGSDADARFYDRLLMFAGASLYAVVATCVFDAFSGTPRSRAARSGRELEDAEPARRPAS